MSLTYWAPDHDTCTADCDAEWDATPEARRANRHAFDAACEAQLTTRPAAHWVEALNAAGIPAGPVYRVDQVFADPQVRHLGLTATVRTPDGANAQVLRYPVTLSATPADVRADPPAPGAHTREVLAELGYDAAAIDALVASGAAAPASPDGAQSWLA